MKKLMKKPFIYISLLVLFVTACLPSQDDVVKILSSVEQTAAASITYVPVSATPDVNLIVAQTFAAMTAQAGGQPLPTFTQIAPAGGTGSISGVLSYPSEFIPPLRVLAVSTVEHGYRYVDTQPGDDTFQITGLAPGSYYVIAYTDSGQEGGLSAGYTFAVLCGLSYECTDHSLIEVVVIAGADTPNINPQDWYAPEGSFPPMPGP